MHAWHHLEVWKTATIRQSKSHRQMANGPGTENQEQGIRNPVFPVYSLNLPESGS